MIQYLNNLIPRLKEFSASLDKIEIFIEKPWVIIDENQNVQKYIFRRNGELIMSLNGQVTVGKWEFLSAAKSLLIDRIQDKILLNQNFIDPAVMILKKDNLYDDNFILANELLLPDLDVKKYLKALYYKKCNVKIVKLKTGELLEVLDFDSDLNQFSYRKVAIDGQSIEDGIYQIEGSKETLVVEKSKIMRVLVFKEYKTKHGKIVIEQEDDYERTGDKVYQNDEKAPDGKYRLGFMSHIIVKDGLIVETVDLRNR